MKKIVSLLIVALMLTATLSMTFTSSAKADYIDYVEALYFETAPNIDGYITTAEWGEATFSVDSDDAVTKDDTDPYMNRYFSWRTGYDMVHMSYQVWLRWDENFYYVGVKVKDEDGHSLKNGKNEAWNGDGVQFRVDNAGPNAASYGETFDTTWSDDGKPWSSSSIGDFVFGYVQIAGGFCEAYENVSNTGMTNFSDPARGVCQTGFVPVGSKLNGADYTPDSATYSTYEIALPWTYVDDKPGYEYSDTLTYNALKNKNIAVGRVYGMSLVVLNAPYDNDLSDGDSGATYRNFLTWGSGVCGVQNTEAPLTCGGSNSVTISKTKVGGTPTTYAAGGYPTQEVKKVFDTTKKYYEDSGINHMLTYDDPGDVDVFGEYGDTPSERIQVDNGNWVIRYDKDDTQDSGLNVQNYLETASGIEHFEIPTSFTIDMKVNVTGTETYEESYGSELYNWFGGGSLVSYECGYFFDDGAFKLVDSSSRKVLASKKVDFSLNTWHDWRFQYDNDTCIMLFFVDNELIFNVKNRYFYYSTKSVTPMIIRRMNVQCMFDDIDIYNFIDYTGITGSSQDVSGNQGGGTQQQETTKKENITNNLVKLDDGNFENTIKFKKDFANASKLAFTVNFDAEKFSYVNVTSAEALGGKYNVVNKEGKIVITITDMAGVRELAEGDDMFKVILKPTAGNEGLTVEDANDLISVLATITTKSGNTGDSMYLIIAGMVIALGAGYAVIRKKKYTEE